MNDVTDYIVSYLANDSSRADSAYKVKQGEIAGSESLRIKMVGGNE